jgi:cyanophycinase
MTRGYIIPIGGAEEKLSGTTILDRFVQVCGGRRAQIAIIPTASRSKKTGDRYERVFRKLGVERVTVLPFEERSDCDRKEWLEVLERVDGVFMTGGNQVRLSTTIGGSAVADLIRERNRDGGLHVAGTSAGASIMAEHMIANGEEGATPQAGMVTLAPGLGLTPDMIVDQHFRQRNRLGRLLAAIAYNPRPIGIGLDEDTAAVLAPDNVIEVVGSGALTVIDASDMEFSSMDSTRDGDPVSLINIRLHVLVEGGTYDIGSRLARPGPGLSRE